MPCATIQNICIQAQEKNSEGNVQNFEGVLPKGDVIIGNFYLLLYIFQYFHFLQDTHALFFTLKNKYPENH